MPLGPGLDGQGMVNNNKQAHEEPEQNSYPYPYPLDCTVLLSAVTHRCHSDPCLYAQFGSLRLQIIQIQSANPILHVPVTEAAAQLR